MVGKLKFIDSILAYNYLILQNVYFFRTYFLNGGLDSSSFPALILAVHIRLLPVELPVEPLYEVRH